MFGISFLGRPVVSLYFVAAVAAQMLFAAPASAQMRGGEKVERVYQLPRIPQLQLPDGRPLDIGRVKGGADNGKLVGYVGSTGEYLNLNDEAMTAIVKTEGFESVAAFEEHLASGGKKRPVRQKAESRSESRTEVNAPAEVDGPAVQPEDRDRGAAANSQAPTTATSDRTSADTTQLLSMIFAALVPVLWLLPLLLGTFLVYRLFRWVVPNVNRPSREELAAEAWTASVEMPARSGASGEGAVAALAKGMIPDLTKTADGPSRMAATSASRQRQAFGKR